MDASNRPTASHLSGVPAGPGALAEHLAKEARTYAFFQAVELIQDRLDAGREVGTHTLAREEKVVFEVAHNLAFPLSDVVSITPTRTDASDEDATSERLKVMVSFLGLHGSDSPLPSYYTEQIAQYDERGSLTKAFFDFFHNRVIGLFHRSWRKFRYYRRYRPGGADAFSGWIFSLFGLGSRESRGQTHIYWPRMLCFAGMLSTRNRSPAMMAAVIAHAFRLSKVDVQEWIKRKVDIGPDQLTRLGQANASLGQTMVLGSQVPDYQGKIRICISDLTFARFQEFLPHGKDFRALTGLVEFMFRDQLAYDLKLGLLPREAHPLTLKSDCAGRLGWSSFLGDRLFDEKREVIIKVRR